ncbi:hypothetical protein WB67_13160 [bacteria symbiont BFo2 of Frankliniella occidentalis]|nr:hypothetical protein WB67_13160 [bacteria symbiont BFo2 of Frankliniella occidentalis]
MANIYDYMRNPKRAVRDGYNPCYMTRVSTVINIFTRNLTGRFRNSLSFGMDETLRENIASSISLIIALIIMISLPISCWLAAFLLPKGGE